MARHGILGAGGIGGLIGAALAKQGDDVTLIVRRESLNTHPRTLKLESAFGKFSVPVEVAAEVDDEYDVLWIATKATQLESALKAVKSYERIKAIVPLLNGVEHVAQLRERYGHDRVVPATISVEAERVSAGHIAHRSPFSRLNVAGSGRDRLAESVEKLSRFGMECKFIEDEATLMWSKLVFLGPFALSTSAAGEPIGGVRDDPQANARLRTCVREFCEVALANGARVNPDAIIGTIEGMPSGMRSSMQKDVAAGNTPEIDAIAGPIIAGGERNDIGTPVTRELVAMIEERLRALTERAS
jgi:2-dehydropantoate 2-reductase